MHLDFERDIVEIQAQIDKLLDLADRRGIDVSDEVRVLRGKLEDLKVQTYDNLKPIEQVQVARHPQRPYTLDYVERIFTDWVELHGDRNFRDDGARKAMVDVAGAWQDCAVALFAAAKDKARPARTPASEDKPEQAAA